MNKNLLYIEDLYSFYVNTYKKSAHFDAQKSGKSIIVQAHGLMNFENSNIYSKTDHTHQTGADLCCKTDSLCLPS